jgi:hypothetical protein
MLREAMHEIFLEGKQTPETWELRAVVALICNPLRVYMG